MERVDIDSVEFEMILNDLSTERVFALHSENLNENCSSSSGEDRLYVPHPLLNSYVKPKPKRFRIRPYTYIPKLARVMRSDVRRFYAEMFINVWNSIDLPLLFGFFDTYFTNNFCQESITPQTSSLALKSRILEGAVSVAKFWYTKMLLSPDSIMTLKDVNVIHSNIQSECRVVARVNIKGTKIFTNPSPIEWAPMRVEPQLMDQYSRGEAMVGHKRNNDSCTYPIIDNIKTCVENFLIHPLNPNPIHIDSDGLLTMYTDKQNLVSKFVMEMLPCGDGSEDRGTGLGREFMRREYQTVFGFMTSDASEKANCLK